MTIPLGIRSRPFSRPFQAIDGDAAAGATLPGGTAANRLCGPTENDTPIGSIESLIDAALPASPARRVGDCVFLDKLDIRIQWLQTVRRWAVVRDIRAADAAGRPVSLTVLEAEYGADDLPRLIINAGALLSRLQIINELDGMTAEEMGAAPP